MARCEGRWQGGKASQARPGANGGEPGAKGGGKVEECQPGSKGGGKGQEGTVQDVPAAGNKVFQGDFVEKMKGEFATGPPPSAEPAAPGLGGGKEPVQGGKCGSQGGQVRVRMWRSSIGLGMGGRIRTHGPNGREANGGSQWGGHHGEEAQEWEPLDQK